MSFPLILETCPLMSEKHQSGKPFEYGRLVGIDYGPTNCGITISNPKFSEWKPFDIIYNTNKEPPNRFSSRFNLNNWGTTRSFDESTSELAKIVLGQKAIGLVIGIPDKPTPEQLMDARTHKRLNTSTNSLYCEDVVKVGETNAEQYAPEQLMDARYVNS
ncbi:hypothetical protein Q3G72_034050 [Acer saccharum]|nr:hypothetical protein Q3G72_034050 [Acer saccharum]